MSDLIDRQKVIDICNRAIDLLNGELGTGAMTAVRDWVVNLPSTQPEPAIPISWIEEEIKRLESRKSSFAVLDAVQLKALIKRWESEQNETD